VPRRAIVASQSNDVLQSLVVIDTVNAVCFLVVGGQQNTSNTFGVRNIFNYSPEICDLKTFSYVVFIILSGGEYQTADASIR